MDLRYVIVRSDWLQAAPPNVRSFMRFSNAQVSTAPHSSESLLQSAHDTCTVSCHTVPCTTLHYTTVHYTTQYTAVQYTVQHCTVEYSAMQNITVHCGTVQRYGTYSTTVLSKNRQRRMATIFHRRVMTTE